MKHVVVTWQPDRDAFVAHGAHAERTIAMNAPHAGGPPTGISPAETLLAALGGCTAWDVVEILRKQRQPLDGVEVRIDGEQLETPPYPYTWIRITYLVSGQGLDAAAVERAVRLSTEKYCSVISTVRGVAAIETAIQLVDAVAGEPAAHGLAVSARADALAADSGTL